MHTGSFNRIISFALCFVMLLGIADNCFKLAVSANEDNETVAEPIEIYAATYEGVLPELPDTVLVTDENGSNYVGVTWENVSADKFVAYDMVAVSGTADGRSVTCYVEVVPGGTVYYLDIGGTTDNKGMKYDSPLYQAVYDLVEKSGLPLYNDKPDQAYSVGSYGHEATSVYYNYDYDADTYSKYVSGIFTANTVGTTLKYYMKLPAGDYKIALGTYDWWPNEGRNANFSITNNKTTEDYGVINYDEAPDMMVFDYTVSQDGIIVLELEENAVESPFLNQKAPLFQFIIVSESNLLDASLTKPDKLYYELGEEFDTTGLSLTAKHGSETVELIDYADITTDFDSSTPGDYIVTVTYRDFSKSFIVTVKDPELVSVEIKSLPDKLEYWVGEDINITGLELTGTYSDGSKTDITSSARLIEYNNNVIGAQEIIIACGGFEVCFTVNFKEITLEGIEVTRKPGKTEYYEGEEFDTTGMLISAVYGDGSTENVTDEIQITGYDPNKLGEQEITVTYLKLFTATFLISVKDLTFYEIEIISEPDRTEYWTGEELDTTGLKVVAYGTNGSEINVSNSVIISGYNTNEEGVQRVVVSYGGKSDDFYVTVFEPTLLGIEIVSLPDKTEYWTGEELDLTGLKITASYNSGSKIDVTEYVQVTGFDSQSEGEQIVTITYGGFNVGFTVNVIVLPVEIESIKVTAVPDKAYYVVGEELDTKGLKVVALYSNGSKLDVTKDAQLTGFDSTKVSQLEITVTYEGLTDSFQIMVNNPSPALNTTDHLAYIEGYEDETVRPEEKMTREEVAMIFYRLMTKDSREYYESYINDFDDVESGRWSNTAISTLTNAGILEGYEDNSFRPEDKIKRAELVKIAVSFEDVTGIEIDINNTQFKDLDENIWYTKYILYAEQYGWLDGYDDGTFRPEISINRAEAIKVINKLLGRGITSEDKLIEGIITYTDNVDKTKWYYYEIIEASNSHIYIIADDQEKWTGLI